MRGEWVAPWGVDELEALDVLEVLRERANAHDVSLHGGGVGGLAPKPTDLLTESAPKRAAATFFLSERTGGAAGVGGGTGSLDPAGRLCDARQRRRDANRGVERRERGDSLGTVGWPNWRAEGLIGAWGLGVNEWQICDRVLDEFEPDCFSLAGRFMLLEQEPLAVFLPRCVERNVSIIVGGPYNSGLLAVADRDQATYDYLPVEDDR